MLAGGTIVGTLAGGLMGQPSAGLLIGLGAGMVGSVLLWLVDRRRA